MESENMQIGLIGSGSWATAIAKILSEKFEDIHLNWFMRKPEEVAFFNQFGHNPTYLSSVLFQKQKVDPTSNLEEVVEKSKIIIFAVPSAFLAETLKNFTKHHFSNKIIITAIKGLIPETRQIVSEYLIDHFDISRQSIACISGPCHAEEVARERLSYLTLSSENQKLAADLSDLFACRYIKTMASKDIVGIEYSAVLKNIYAIASGIANGLGYGDNFKAVLISYGIREIEDFLTALGITNINVNESAYLGDLLVTAYSQFSRNRTFGNMLGRGYSVPSAQVEMNMIAEGYYSTKQIYLIKAQLPELTMPVLEAVYAVIYEGKSAQKQFEILSDKIN